jgi:hypothetical protein
MKEPKYWTALGWFFIGTGLLIIISAVVGFIVHHMGPSGGLP